jgi:hypothetical protein
MRIELVIRMRTLYHTWLRATDTRILICVLNVVADRVTCMHRKYENGYRGREASLTTLDTILNI